MDRSNKNSRQQVANVSYYSIYKDLTMMIKVLSLLLCLASIQAFAPAAQPATSTALNMGLFDAFQPKKKPESGGMDKNVFGGRGARITIREDEDAAMWIEEDDKKKKGKKGK